MDIKVENNNFELLSDSITTERDDRIRYVGQAFEDQVRSNNEFYETPNAVNVLNNPQLMVYPNPAQSKLTVSGTSEGSNTGKVIIFSLDGEKIYDSGYDIVFPHQIDVSSYSPGIYIVNVIKGNQNLTKKIVIE